MTRKNTKKLQAPSPKLGRKDIGHWKFNREFRQSEWFGFIYCITRKSDGKFYIGKKQLNIGGRKTRTVKGKRVLNTKFGKTTDWRSYTGSSDLLNKEIKEQGKTSFDFEIVDLYRTKGGLYYAEAYLQMVTNSVPLRMKDSDEFASYNKVIAPIRFVPVELPTYKTKTFTSKIRKRLSK